MTKVMDRVGQSRPTVYRILALLQVAGLLVREPHGKSYTVSQSHGKSYTVSQ